MVKKDKGWVEAQGLAAAQDLRRLLGGGLYAGVQEFMTGVVRAAFREGMKRGEYKCVDFLVTLGKGYEGMGFERSGIEFVKASKTVKDQLDKKYDLPDPEKEADYAAQSTFRD